MSENNCRLMLHSPQPGTRLDKTPQYLTYIPLKIFMDTISLKKRTLEPQIPTNEESPDLLMNSFLCEKGIANKSSPHLWAMETTASYLLGTIKQLKKKNDNVWRYMPRHTPRFQSLKNDIVSLRLAINSRTKKTTAVFLSKASNTYSVMLDTYS